MSKYWILDREDTPQAFPLRKLLEQIQKAVGPSRCEFLLRRADGYGESIQRWNTLLDEADEIVVSADELERVSAGTDEWFYNLSAKCSTPSGTIDFGVHDSAALYVDAPPMIAKRLLATFKEVRAE